MLWSWATSVSLEISTFRRYGANEYCISAFQKWRQDKKRINSNNMKTIWQWSQTTWQICCSAFFSLFGRPLLTVFWGSKYLSFSCRRRAEGASLFGCPELTVFWGSTYLPFSCRRRYERRELSCCRPVFPYLVVLSCLCFGGPTYLSFSCRTIRK